MTIGRKPKANLLIAGTVEKVCNNIFNEKAMPDIPKRIFVVRFSFKFEIIFFEIIPDTNL